MVVVFCKLSATDACTWIDVSCSHTVEAAVTVVNSASSLVHFPMLESFKIPIIL